MPLIVFERPEGCETAGPFKLKSWKAMFRDREHGWSPLLWVVYLGFFFVDPVMSHASASRWLLDGLGAAVFLCLYFGLFVLARPRALAHIVGMVLLGVVYLPLNGGDCTFFIFAAAMVPFCVESQRAAVIGLLAVGATGAVECLVLHIYGWGMFYAALFPMIIGAGKT